MSQFRKSRFNSLPSSLSADFEDDQVSPDNGSITADSNPSLNHLTRTHSNSITNRYSKLRNSSSTSTEAHFDSNLSASNLSNSNSSSSNLSISSSLSPVLAPVRKIIGKNVNNIVSKIPSPSNNDNGVLVNLLKKANIGLFSDADRPYTEGPITKTYDSFISTESGPSIDIDNIEELSLDNLGHENEIILKNPIIPEILITGLPLLRVTRKKRTQRFFKIDIDKATLSWKTNRFMFLDKIQQIRVGDDARNYREEYGVSKEYNDRWATIIYYDNSSSKLKALHIIAPSIEDFNKFISTLSKLVRRRRELMKYLAIPGENFANIHWRNYVSKDNNKKELLSFQDILNLTKRLHINCEEKLLLNIFDKCDVGSKRALNFEEFQKFVKKLKVRPEIEEIFKRVTTSRISMSYEEFASFIKKTQNQDDSDEKILRLFEKYTSSSGSFDIDSFTNYLTSSHLNPTRAIEEDFSRPLNEYFISSSHNTYLIGRQYGGNSSVEGYIRALQRGCRSIEIDIWDNEQGPVVRHGKLTGFIPVRDVFDVIRKYAFIMSPFPLILSLEIHCKAEYQYKVKDLILEIFGDVLITESLFTNTFQLPCPIDLKHKVLVKVKRTEANSDESFSGSQSSSFASSSTTAHEETSADELDQKNTKKKRKNFQIIRELSDLGVYFSGLKFRNFSLPESKTINHIFSFNESRFNTMIKDKEKEYLILKHNRKYFMRVYPSGYRYNSTNFSPIKFWDYGVQMVATNWQKYDLGQQINEAMFNVGSRSGYILKPDTLRNLNSSFKFKLLKSVPHSVVKFRIDIISGQLLPRPNELKSDEQLSPSVLFDVLEPSKLEELTVNDLRINTKYSTTTGPFATNVIYSNGFNPVWNYKFQGKIRSLNGLDIIRFQVKTGDTIFAVNCFKLDNMNQGYRHIPLYDLQGEEYIFSTLFVYINYEYTNE